MISITMIIYVCSGAHKSDPLLLEMKASNQIEPITSTNAAGDMKPNPGGGGGGLIHVAHNRMGRICHAR